MCFTKINLRIVFLFGLTKVKATQELIENESIVYATLFRGILGHLPQPDPQGALLAYRWTQDFCQQSRDDCQSRRRHVSQCLYSPGKVFTPNSNRNWFRGYSHYPTNYCNGYLVLISRDIIRPMYRASFLTPFFWVDDVYLYGFAPRQGWEREA
ncbi:uncharacterized protein LOC121374624 [Gigantopelta aegis]|uniref:uncharacterized protein LOC121374624 n=1 Tax=Gigantopelta aegis TaxID=1735272 RepID=UPI001B8877A4|nr:uncharacterized protein LOC121374624 [Gigantopelta aegis]